MIKKITEFKNSAVDKSVSNMTQDVKSNMELADQIGFNVTQNSTDEQGLAISDSDMIAVQYLADGNVSIVLNNDLTLDAQAVNVFKKEFGQAEKLMQEIQNNNK